jgi:ribosomal protein S12 methylthiotransferase accessory factor
LRRIASRRQVVDCPRPADAALDEAAVHSVAVGADLLVCAFDRGFTAAHHWVNRASLASRVPALFLAAAGLRATIGPLVIPGETACFMCWRMREIAAAKDFEAAMAYEEHVDASRRPALASRPTLPALAALAAGVAAAELVKLATAIGVHTLAGRVSEYDALSSETTSRPILFRPDCPACRKGKGFGRGGIDRSLLRADAGGAATGSDLLAVAPTLVDERTGVVRRLERVTKDPSEPERPYIFRAELANMRFLADRETASITCSGKGFTHDAARVSALGEAVERYAGSLWLSDEVTRARRADLPGPSLDPVRLVLFHDSQYPRLRYAPWREDVEHGWVRASALGAGGEVFVPALAAYMAYETPRREEFLFPISSSGLAAGPTQIEAVFRAALEVIERDAFLIAWMHRLPCRRIDPATHPDKDVRAIVAAHARRSIRLELYRPPMDTPVHAFMAVGYDEGDLGGPAAVVGLGAHPDAAHAARSAVLEVGQVRPALRIRLRDPAVRKRMERLVADPSAVETLEDHDLRYAARGARGAFGFLRDRPMQAFDWAEAAAPPGSTADALERLVAALRTIGSDLLAVVLTTPDILRAGLHVARAILPDFQPIHFGHAEARLGGRRLFELPRRLGLVDHVLGLADLNLDPHPLA